MARPKRIKAQPTSQTSLDLLEQIKAAVGEITLPNGTKQDWNPVVQLAQFAADKSDSDDAAIKKLRLEAAKEVAKYLHAPLKSIEVVGAGGGPLEIRLKQY